MIKLLFSLMFFSALAVAWEKQIEVPYSDFWGQSISRCQVFFTKLTLSKAPFFKNTTWLKKINPNKLVLPSMLPRSQQIQGAAPVGSTSYEVNFNHIKYILDNQESNEPFFTQTPKALLINKVLTETIPQEIFQTTPKDKEIIDLSFANNHVREVARINVRTKNGNALSSQLLIGRHSLVNVNMKAYETLLNEARLMNELPEEIETVHSHPSIEFVIETNDSIRLMLAPLSNSDIEGARSTSKKYRDILITEKAVTPQGLAYCVKFRNGKQVWPVEET